MLRRALSYTDDTLQKLQLMYDGGCPVPHINKLKELHPLNKVRANEALVSFHCLLEGIAQNRINNKRIK